MQKRFLIGIPAAIVALAMTGFAGREWFQQGGYAATSSLPSTIVKRGDVTFTINAKGELQGGNSEMLSAPMTGGKQLAITSLRESGELVKEGDVVVQFDTTEQDFKLREAEADLAEAEQQVIQAKAESVAKAEEARYALLQAKTELKVAELEARKNESLARIAARLNELAVSAAADKVRQLEGDLNDRIAAAEAGIAIQDAARSKAKVAAETARRNIESMTLKAKSTGTSRASKTTAGTLTGGRTCPRFR